MKTTRLLFRWGVWMCYSEWKPDQPEGNWDGELLIDKGKLSNPNLVIYSGCFGPQHRTLVPLDKPQWKSRMDYPRPWFGYKGLEGLQIDVEGDSHCRLSFNSAMINVDFRIGDIPENGRLVWNAGPKYSCLQLSVCRIEDEGFYWNNNPADKCRDLRASNIRVLDLDLFKGDFLQRVLHHRISAWVPPNGTVHIPFRWPSQKPAIATWYFTGAPWNPLSETPMSEYFTGHNSPMVIFKTQLDGLELNTSQLRAKYVRGARSTLEHTDELGLSDRNSEHVLSITNLSRDNTYLVLYPLVLMEKPENWSFIKQCLPFQPTWSAGKQRLGDFSSDIPTDGKGILIGYDTNTMAAENGWIDAVIRFLTSTRNGNFVMFRTETDLVSKNDWERWFTACRNKGIHFAVNPGILLYAVEKNRVPTEEILDMAVNLGGPYFLGVKSHEVSIPLYSGWKDAIIPEDTDLRQAEENFLKHIRDSYAAVQNKQCRQIIGEAMLAHRYDYKAGVELILSETMTGNTCLLLAEARGAARAYNRKLWGMHIACHVNCMPEDWRHERMFRLNLHIGYLSGAGIIEDEEGGLAKVHSFVSGPSEPLPSARQKTIADFHTWASENPRTSQLQVETGFIYGRHEIITGGLSLNTKRPVRVWEGFGPEAPEWNYGLPEYGWLLMDVFMPGVWMCPILNDKKKLRRWFTGTPHGQVDIVPVEADVECLLSYKLLVFPGWHTMTAQDAVKLTDYAARGGTLLIGLCHLQNSADRTKVISAADWSFIDNRSINQLCGFELKKDCPYSVEPVAKDEHIQCGQQDNIKIMDVSASTGRPVMTLGQKPLLFENKIGKGRVFTCTALEFFGRPSLLALLKAWMQKLIRRIDFDIHLQGGENEVMYFVYPAENNKKDIFLVNTDWTTEENVKTCRLTDRNGLTTDVKVKQGEIVKVTL